MSKLHKLIQAIRQIIKQPALLNLVLDADGPRKENVIRKYKLHQGLAQVKLETLFGSSLEENIQPFAFLDGGSLPTDLLLLKQCARQFYDCKYFEIGTWRGESVANVADTGASCHTLCLSDEEMRTLGCDDAYIQLHGHFSKHLPNVQQWRGNSITFDYSQLPSPFDLVFIDGDHHYASVKSDTEQVFKHLLHDKSIVVWHDYGHEPDSVRWEVFEGILDGTPAEKRKYLYHVANTKCAIYWPKAFKTQKLQSPSTPQTDFKLTVKLG